MSAPGPNLPLVIQQAGKASLVQESVQRAGENQQAAAQEQVARKEELEKSQVQKSDASDAQNRIRSEAEQKRRRRREQQNKRKKKKQASGPIDAQMAGEGLLVDEVV